MCEGGGLGVESTEAHRITTSDQTVKPPAVWAQSLTLVTPLPSPFQVAGVVAAGLVLGALALCVTVIALGRSGMHQQPVGLLSKRQTSILAVSKGLEKLKVSPVVSLRAAQALSAFHSLCGAPSSQGTITKSEMQRRRQRADSNWWNVIKAFKVPCPCSPKFPLASRPVPSRTAPPSVLPSLPSSRSCLACSSPPPHLHTPLPASSSPRSSLPTPLPSQHPPTPTAHVPPRPQTADEVQSAVLADPSHVHLIIYVAPGWCHFSQMQITELQKNFDNLGTSQNRVHFIGATPFPLPHPNPGKSRGIRWPQQSPNLAH